MPVEIRIPAMGEGIMDVTITQWLKKEGDSVIKDTPLVEIATDKVDSEILAPSDGILEKTHFKEGDVVKIGEIIAFFSGDKDEIIKNSAKAKHQKEKSMTEISKPEKNIMKRREVAPANYKDVQKIAANKFISPYIRNIALQKGIPVAELEKIPGSGIDERLTKEDILQYLGKIEKPKIISQIAEIESNTLITKDPDVEYVELSRMRMAIAKNMIYSKQVSPHVTSFVEVNLSHIVNWRNKVKNSFFEKHGEKITFLPFIIQAVAKALNEFPYINASFDNERLIIKKSINIGIATALPDGNLIVPVIKNANNLNLAGIAKSLNTLIKKARESTILSEDITGGTFTITNIGTFGNIGGTPIINQPQLAILAVGEIVKKPVAIKTGENYGIAIQDIAEFWLSYDHRIIDGFMGGSFLKRIATILEQFDDATNI